VAPEGGDAAVIMLGLDEAAKQAEIVRYCAEHEIRKVVVFSPQRFRPALDLPVPHEHVEWAEIILYKFYYRLLREIDGSTLLVVNECLRTQNRNELTYNCLRLFLKQTSHQVVFQYLPLIDTFDDFAILFDLDTKSRWKREKIGQDMLRQTTIRVAPVELELRPLPVPVDAKLAAAYAWEKEKLLAEVRDDVDKDPHLIARNLLLVSGKAKLPHIDPARRYVGRNNRYKLPNLETYREATGAGERVVFELPHNFIDLADFLAVSRQSTVDVLVADTKAERWYLDRHQAWAQRVRDAYAALGAP
jgi:hypothetical protein